MGGLLRSDPFPLQKQIADGEKHGNKGMVPAFSDEGSGCGTISRESGALKRTGAARKDYSTKYRKLLSFFYYILTGKRLWLYTYNKVQRRRRS